jgi:hypothetical protein
MRANFDFDNRLVIRFLRVLFTPRRRRVTWRFFLITLGLLRFESLDRDALDCFRLRLRPLPVSMLTAVFFAAPTALLFKLFESFCPLSMSEITFFVAEMACGTKLRTTERKTGTAALKPDSILIKLFRR